MEREKERENQRVMDDDIENSSDGEVMFTGPTQSKYSVVVDSEFPRQIQNQPFHPSHPLFLVKRKDFGANKCDSCGKGCSKGIFYRCDLCDFDLDTNCAKLFPRQFQNHPFHPSHPLFLVKPKAFGPNRCNSCGLFYDEGIFFYRCDLCDFDLDTNCAKLIPPTIKYLGHPDHLLSLYNLDSYSHLYHPCKACQKKCDGHVLRCAPCNFNLHLHCLPLKVRHKNHRHFFTLTASIKEEDRGINELVCFECDAKINPNEAVYYCAKCYYPLHIGCSSEAIADHHESGQVLVEMDEAMMMLMNDVEVETTELNELKSQVEVQTTELNELKSHVAWITTDLNIKKKYLKAISPHKEASTKFPLKVKHPFHSQHPLTLTDGQSDYNCSVCMKIHRGFKYHCLECDFFLDLNCVLRKPTIKYDGHQKHLLIFLKKIVGCHKCNACKQDCKTSPILRCADCDFNLHIDCFHSLPPTFKNPQCHLHTLTLTNSFASDLSTNEFYCDFCEDKGDPELPVYVYCSEECSFFAHVTCVLYEELPSILAELDGTKRDDGVVEECVFVDVSNDKIDDEDPTLAKIDAEQRELQLRLEELEGKLGEIKVKQKELDDKRAQYLASVF